MGRGLRLRLGGRSANLSGHLLLGFLRGICLRFRAGGRGNDLSVCGRRGPWCFGRYFGLDCIWGFRLGCDWVCSLIVSLDFDQGRGLDLGRRRRIVRFHTHGIIGGGGVHPWRGWLSRSLRRRRWHRCRLLRRRLGHCGDLGRDRRHLGLPVRSGKLHGGGVQAGSARPFSRSFIHAHIHGLRISFGYCLHRGCGSLGIGRSLGGSSDGLGRREWRWRHFLVRIDCVLLFLGGGCELGLGDGDGRCLVVRREGGWREGGIDLVAHG